MIVSGGQQRDSAVHTHAPVLCQTPLPSRLPRAIEQGGLGGEVAVIEYPPGGLFSLGDRPWLWSAGIGQGQVQAAVVFSVLCTCALLTTLHVGPGDGSYY